MMATKGGDDGGSMTRNRSTAVVVVIVFIVTAAAVNTIFFSVCYLYVVFYSSQVGRSLRVPPVLPGTSLIWNNHAHYNLWWCHAFLPIFWLCNDIFFTCILYSTMTAMPFVSWLKIRSSASVDVDRNSYRQSLSSLSHGPASASRVSASISFAIDN